jgi:hypothetical protein
MRDAFEEATWAANLPSRLTFSAPARSMTIAYLPPKNRFEIFGACVPSPGGCNLSGPITDKTEYIEFSMWCQDQAYKTGGIGVPSPGLLPGAGRGGRGPGAGGGSRGTRGSGLPTMGDGCQGLGGRWAVALHVLMKVVIAPRREPVDPRGRVMAGHLRQAAL